jgi:hypothetical protein
MTISTVIYATKNFFLIEALNEQIDKLNTVGFINYWHAKMLDEEKIYPDEENDARFLTVSQLSVDCSSPFVKNPGVPRRLKNG